MDEICATKLKRVLRELLKSDYKISDDTILEKLFTHLSTKGIENVCDLSTYIEWIQCVFQAWNQKTISSPVASFALRLLGLVIADEQRFNNMYQAPGGNEFFNYILDLIKPNSENCCSPSMKYAHVSMLCNALKHASGQHWILSSRVWIDVLHMGRYDSSIYVVRESRKFLTNLMNELPISHQTMAEELLTHILEPVIALSSQSKRTAEKDENEWKNIVPTLHIINDILCHTFSKKDTESQKIKSVVVSLVNNPQFSLLSRSAELFKITDNEDVLELLSKIITVLYIIGAINDKDCKMSETCTNILNIFNTLISKGSVSNVLKLCVMCHHYWSHVPPCKQPVDDKDGKMYQFEDQLICLQMVPMYVGVVYDQSSAGEQFAHNLLSRIHQEVSRSGYLLRNAVISNHLLESAPYQSISSLLSLMPILTKMVPAFVGVRITMTPLEEAFHFKLLAQLTSDTIRLGYNFRDLIIQKQHVHQPCLFAINNFLSLRATMSRERAVLVFQSFVYVLKHFVVYDGEEKEEGRANVPGGWGGEFLSAQHSNLLVAILDGLAKLVRTFRITWRESVESLCLLPLAQQLLLSSKLSSKMGMTVQVLQLIQLSIENLMPPNLALLTNTMTGTGFDQLGALIHKHLHNAHWEVRDSSLEVLHVIATISDTKYPLFQDLILENKLCDLVVFLAINDAENYVCASAMKCLSAMVGVDRLWNEELCNYNLVDKLIGVLSGESEGIVRREASTLVGEIYKHQKVMPNILSSLYATMANVVLSDLHWEVKVNALQFWQLVIDRLMTDQGMIDGVFPSVTFSKEHRKIMNLTPAAVQDRLRKVLDELSRIGCLHILSSAIHNEEDLEVVKKAVQINTALSKLLEQYGVLTKNKCSADEASTTSQLQSDFNSQGTSQQSFENPSKEVNQKTVNNSGVQSNQDEVIDSILNDRDINLLVSVYQGAEPLLLGREGPETKVTKSIKAPVILSPTEFLQQLKHLDGDKIVNERKRWIEDTGNDLSILLQDMLILREMISDDDDDDERNAIDCY